MPPGRPNKAIQKTQIARAETVKMLRREMRWKQPGQALLEQKHTKRRMLKMLMLHVFLPNNIHLRVLSKSSRTRARRGSKKGIKNWQSTKPKIANVDEHLPKSIEDAKIIHKTQSETDCWRFWLDFGVPWRVQKSEKSTRKQAESKAIFKKQKKQKQSKTARSRFARRNAQTNGEDMEGRRRLPKQEKPCKQTKTEIEDGEKNLEESVEPTST